MTDKQRFINCVLGKEIDRSPFMYYFGPWGETAKRWLGEGAHDENAWCAPELGFDSPIEGMAGHVNHYFDPFFKHKVLSEQGEKVIYQDAFGVVNEGYKGVSAIPKIISNPITSRKDWDEMVQTRLKKNFAIRIPSNFQETCKKLTDSGKAIQVGNFPYGIFGTLRDLFGVEELLFMFYDDPDLIKDIMNYLTDFWIGIYEEIAKYIQIDIIHIWEDMSGKQGSLISPAMVEEFMLPCYRKFKSFAVKHNVPVFVVDTDGKCDELIPLFASAGVNMMLPFEVQAGNNAQELRSRFPYMTIFGGIDKMALAKGKNEIDKELKKIETIINKPGFIPQLDHLIPPEVSYENYLYYCKRLKEMCGKKGQ